MSSTPKIILVKDTAIKENIRYRLYIGRTNDTVTHLALSLYGALTLEMLRSQVPEVRFEETFVFADIIREHHPSPEHPGPIAKFWSQRPVLHPRRRAVQPIREGICRRVACRALDGDHPLSLQRTGRRLTTASPPLPRTRNAGLFLYLNIPLYQPQSLLPLTKLHFGCIMYGQCQSRLFR